MNTAADSPELLAFIVNRVNLGVFIIDLDMNVLLWNQFMSIHSGKAANEVIGNNLFELFNELPEKWFRKKIKSVIVLKNLAFTSWEQRPYLFKFSHNRPITGGVEFMNQDLTLMPIKNDAGEVTQVCVTLLDSTDVSIYQTKLKEAMVQLEAASRIDGLTQLNNRGHWEQRLVDEVSRVKRYGGNLSLLMLDIDHFKKINDQYGHLAGDGVIKCVSNEIAEAIRENDIAGRYGGEEFGVILPSTPLEGAKIVAERLRTRIESKHVMIEDEQVSFTVSVGAALQTSDMTEHEELISQADEALYQSKQNGRNQTTFYSCNE